jgi:FkbM family methyltransferase
VHRNIRNGLERLIEIVGDATGIEPVRLKQTARGGRVLRRLAATCGSINTIVDVGASDGRWSQGARALWPDANYLLVEAQHIHHAALATYAATHGKTFVVKAAASNRVGEIHFDTTRAYGGEASAEAFSRNDAVLPCTTLDTEIERFKLPGPYLIKLDTHGHEREILQGAEAALQDAGLLIIEAYNFSKPNRMYFWQLCALMNERGFRTASMSDPLMADDGVLRQMDLYFMPPGNHGFDRVE